MTPMKAFFALNKLLGLFALSKHQRHVRKDLADSRDRSQQEPGLRVVDLGLAEYLQLQPLPERVVMSDHLQVGCDVVPGARFGEAVQHVPIASVLQPFLEWIEVVLVVDQLHMREEFAASAH